MNRIKNHHQQLSEVMILDCDTPFSTFSTFQKINYLEKYFCFRLEILLYSLDKGRDLHEQLVIKYFLTEHLDYTSRYQYWAGIKGKHRRLNQQFHFNRYMDN